VVHFLYPRQQWTSRSIVPSGKKQTIAETDKLYIGSYTVGVRVGHQGCGRGSGLCNHDAAIFHLNVFQHVRVIGSDSGCQCRGPRLRGFGMEGEGACLRQSLYCSIRSRRHGSRVRLTSRVCTYAIYILVTYQSGDFNLVRGFSESRGVGCFQPC